MLISIIFIVILIFAVLFSSYEIYHISKDDKGMALQLLGIDVIGFIVGVIFLLSEPSEFRTIIGFIFFGEGN